MNSLVLALNRKNQGRPPVWFMRQAGRYHSHYQVLRGKYSFMELCKKPEVACEVTMGPIRDFDFDAAILFSDLLFPLEVMGMGLRYDEGPKLDWHLREVSDLKRLASGASLVSGLEFQGQAMSLIRKSLPTEKGLIGFVGAPLTLFYYAVEGSHQGKLNSAYDGLRDGRFTGFCEKLQDLLIENMVLQAQAGADAIALFDTCGGEVDAETYQTIVVPELSRVLTRFKERMPHTPIIYYSRGTGPAHWTSLKGLPISCMGIDWRHDLPTVLSEWTENFAIQGNFDPNLLFLPAKELEARLRNYFESIQKIQTRYLDGWVSGLGHGVLPATPEENVKLFIRLQKEYFSKR